MSADPDPPVLKSNRNPSYCPPKGFASFTNIVALALEMGIKEVTTYALSIENLKRPEEELQGLFGLMEEKFGNLVDGIEGFVQQNVALRFVGDLSLLPQRLQEICGRIDREMGRVKSPRLTCYLAICYTSRCEISTGMRHLVGEVGRGALRSAQINEDLLRRNMFTPEYPVDLLVRTSGETRLSDFLLWQSAGAILFFTEVLWPEFDRWEMLKSVLYFQFHHTKGSLNLRLLEELGCGVEGQKNNWK